MTSDTRHLEISDPSEPRDTLTPLRGGIRVVSRRWVDPIRRHLATPSDTLISKVSHKLCHCCGEPAARHYKGVLLGCRVGRSFYRPAMELGL